MKKILVLLLAMGSFSAMGQITVYQEAPVRIFYREKPRAPEERYHTNEVYRTNEITQTNLISVTNLTERIVERTNVINATNFVTNAVLSVSALHVVRIEPDGTEVHECVRLEEFKGDKKISHPFHVPEVVLYVLHVKSSLPREATADWVDRAVDAVHSKRGDHYATQHHKDYEKNYATLADEAKGALPPPGDITLLDARFSHAPYRTYLQGIPITRD